MPPRPPNGSQNQASSASATHVLGEITNSPQQSSAPGPRPSGYSKVSSAIQHFSRLTSNASSGPRPAVTRPLKVDKPDESATREGLAQPQHHRQQPQADEQRTQPLDQDRTQAHQAARPTAEVVTPIRRQQAESHSSPVARQDKAVDKRVSQSSTCTNSSSASGGHRRKTHVGPWRLGRTLGRGSSGRVRLAKHAKTGMLAAVKIVPKSQNLEDKPVDESGGKKGKDAAGLAYGIEREVIIMKLIEHPNVLGLYDVWENRGELYLILEYVEGGELFDYLIKRGRLDEKEAVHYFRQIILGIDYCHKFNICHRDLKPENLLLDKYHNIKIADFGMAALEATGRMLETSCGSPHYASPEIVAGKTYHGAPSDIWSCGIILFALLTGHLPFDDDNIRNLLMKVQTGRFQMPSDLSFHAKDLIWRILKTDPDERITAAEILEHPLLRKYPAENAAALPFEPSVKVDRPVESYEDIDMEIVKNLQTLWHGVDRDIIIDRLLSSDSNSEKTFYCLLLKYRHDHQEDYGSTDNSPRSSPQNQKAKRSVSNQRLSSRGRVSTSPHTPSKGSKHRKSASKGSVVSVSSSRKRGVDFSHARKRSMRSTSSTTSLKSQSSLAHGRPGYEPEPPLPQSSSLLIAAIDQLTMSLAAGPATYTEKEASADLPSSPVTYMAPPGLSPSLSASPPSSLPSSPVQPLQRAYTVRSAKEGKKPSGVRLVGTDDDVEEDRLRKISADFAASICELAFNSRSVSDSSNDTAGSRATSASSTSTAATSVGASPRLVQSRNFSPSTGPLQLSFEPIKSTSDHVDAESKDQWVREFEQYLQSTTRMSMSKASKASAAELPAITEESPAHVDEGRFVDAEEEDLDDFATQIQNLLNTPPVLKRQSTVSAATTNTKAPRYSMISQTPSSAMSLDYSRLRISSILSTDSFYGSEKEEQVHASKTDRRNISGGSATTVGTTIRHVSAMSAVAIPEEPADHTATGSSNVIGRQKSVNDESLRARATSAESAGEGAGRRSSSIVGAGGARTSSQYRQYTPLMLDFEERQQQPRVEIKSMLDVEPQYTSRPVSALPLPKVTSQRLYENPGVAPSPPVARGDTRWTRFQRHLMPRRAAPPPPSLKPKRKSKKERKSNMFKDVVPRPITSKPKQSWFAKVLNGIL